MKSKLLQVPQDLMTEFAIELSDRQLQNEIKGANDENEILVAVYHDSSSQQDVYDLIAWLDERVPDDDDEDDDEDDDDDDDD